MAYFSKILQKIHHSFSQVNRVTFPKFRKNAAQHAKKPRRVCRPQAANKVKSFSAGACTWQKIPYSLRSVRVGRPRRPRSARSRLQSPFVPKGRWPLGTIQKRRSLRCAAYRLSLDYAADYSLGPASTRALPASLPSYLTKFLTNRPARSLALVSQSSTLA